MAQLVKYTLYLRPITHMVKKPDVGDPEIPWYLTDMTLSDHSSSMTHRLDAGSSIGWWDDPRGQLGLGARNRRVIK